MLLPINPNNRPLSPLSFSCLLLYISIIRVNLGKIRNNLIFKNKLKCDSDLIFNNGGSSFHNLSATKHSYMLNKKWKR